MVRAGTIFPLVICNHQIFLCSRRPSATLRQRLLGSSSPQAPARAVRPGDRGEVSRMWQQLKTDIETAMAKKPDKESGGQYKRFSVIRSQVGACVCIMYMYFGGWCESLFV